MSKFDYDALLKAQKEMDEIGSDMIDSIVISLANDGSMWFCKELGCWVQKRGGNLVSLKRVKNEGN